jgi:very-short-patch-repair endonuclease
LGWVADAIRSHRVSSSELREELLRRRRVRHGEFLREVLDDVASGAESAAELAYVRRAERAHGLPEAIRQMPRNGGAQRHDNAYSEFANLVEVDGRLHGAWSARVRDGARDRQASAQGWLTDRVFWADVGPRACTTAAEIAAVLGARGWKGRPHPCRRPLCALRGGLTGSGTHQPTT